MKVLIFIFISFFGTSIEGFVNSFTYSLEKWSNVKHLCLTVYSPYHDNCHMRTVIILVQPNRTANLDLPCAGPLKLEYKPLTDECVNADGSRDCYIEQVTKYLSYVGSKLCTNQEKSSVCTNVPMAGCVLPASLVPKQTVSPGNVPRQKEGYEKQKSSTFGPSDNNSVNTDSIKVLPKKKGDDKQNWFIPVGILGIVLSVVVISTLVYHLNCRTRKPPLVENGESLSHLQKIPGTDELNDRPQNPDIMEGDTGDTERPMNAEELEDDESVLLRDHADVDRCPLKISYDYCRDSWPQRYTATEMGPRNSGSEVIRHEAWEPRMELSVSSPPANPLYVAEEEGPGNNSIVENEVVHENVPRMVQEQNPGNPAAILSEEEGGTRGPNDEGASSSS